MSSPFIYNISVERIRARIKSVLLLMLTHKFRQQGEFYDSTCSNTFRIYELFEYIKNVASIEVCLIMAIDYFNEMKNTKNITQIIIENYFKTIDELSFCSIKITTSKQLDLIYQILTFFPNIKKIDFEETNLELISPYMLIFFEKIKTIESLKSINFSNNTYNLYDYEDINNEELKQKILTKLFSQFETVELAALNIDDDELEYLMTMMSTMGDTCKTLHLNLSNNQFIKGGKIFNYLKHIPLKSINISYCYFQNIYSTYLELIEYLKETDLCCESIELSNNFPRVDVYENDEDIPEEDIFDESKLAIIKSKLMEVTSTLNLTHLRLPSTQPFISNELNDVFGKIVENNLQMYWKPQYTYLFSTHFYKVVITFLILNNSDYDMPRLPQIVCNSIFGFFNRKLQLQFENE